MNLEEGRCLAALEELVPLLLAQRRRALASGERTRLEALEAEVRGALEGARLAPRAIEGHAKAEADPPRTSVSATERAGPVEPAPRAPTPPEPARAPTAHSVLEELTVSREVAMRLRPVQTPSSGYSRDLRPSFLDAYYEDTIDTLPSEPPKRAPRRVIGADGASAQLSDRARELLGVEPADSQLATIDAGPSPSPSAPEPRSSLSEPAPEPLSSPLPGPGSSSRVPRPSGAADAPRVGPVTADSAAPSSGPTVSRRPPPPSKSRDVPSTAARAAAPRRAESARAKGPDADSPRTSRPQATGSSAAPPRSNARVRRPASTPASSSAGVRVLVRMRDGSDRKGTVAEFVPAQGILRLEEGPLELSEVLAIYFAAQTPRSGRPSGRKVSLTLLDERRIAGYSPDYRAGAESITVVPAVAKGGVDRVWVPASAVKAIAVAEA